MKLRIVSMIARAIFLSVILNCISAFAQLAEPANDLGVRLGHIHLVVKNVEAQTKFWTEMMGGTVVKNGPLTLIQFPGVFIMLRQGDPKAPPAGSIVDHFGFVLKDINAAREMEGCRCQVHDWSDEPQSGLRRGSGWSSRGSVWRSIIAGPGRDGSHSHASSSDGYSCNPGLVR